jgi:hypothetical protein
MFVRVVLCSDAEERAAANLDETGAGEKKKRAIKVI